MRRWGRRNAGLYSAWAKILALAGYRRMLRRAISSLPHLGLVAEIGCGDGEVLRLLAGSRPKLTVLACDLSPEFLPLAARGHPRARLLAADAESIPIRSGSVDAVLSFGVLGHLLDPAEAIAELARIVRPAGVLAVWTRTDGLFSRCVARLFERMNPGVRFSLHDPGAIHHHLAETCRGGLIENRVAGGHLWIGRRSAYRSP